jgi:hypothetical protein
MRSDPRTPPGFLTRSPSTAVAPPPGNLPLGVGQQERRWLGKGELDGAVPYTIWSGRDDGACRHKPPKRSSPTDRSRHLHQDKPDTTMTVGGEGVAELQATARENSPPDKQRRASCLATLPRRHGRPRGAKPRASFSSTPLLLATMAG